MEYRYPFFKCVQKAKIPDGISDKLAETPNWSFFDHFLKFDTNLITFLFGLCHTVFDSIFFTLAAIIVEYRYLNIFLLMWSK
jgi:hypothetical protein